MGFESPHSWVAQVTYLMPWHCHLPSAWKKIRMSFWDSRVPLWMAGTEKAWNTGRSVPEQGRSCSLEVRSRAQAELNTDWPKTLRSKGKSPLGRVPSADKETWCWGGACGGRGQEAVSALSAGEDFCDTGKGHRVSEGRQEEPGQSNQESQGWCESDGSLSLCVAEGKLQRRWCWDQSKCDYQHWIHLSSN